ncbi:D-arabinose 1-dehydrogenase, Zn-dependent alcohol dehydrogenase family [Agromyces sp. CF514]|uniref:zinc-dependent alcohol dehydrogenase n=1 Tax=Agromyces sp. CF514 TaxID=1881031 RepID=UPI0008E02050|nr:alcohol dehydrogenase catalytic domain-containing protein [Agromyces sp. CF514]SFR78347.1 D-arabinose 1-dehydrogenase, Zn-dependent alcohol dehydrogenase family [Agromyces sp. CF514]
MKAFVIRGPHDAGVEDVPPPVAAPGEVVVDVARAGVCGTDVEFFTGEMQYLHEGHAGFPMRIGHEWSGTVSALGDGVERGWLGRRVTGDTMLGCGVCPRCRDGRQHVCEFRAEVGIRGGRHGALAERVAIPARALHALPDDVDDAMGAMIEPGGNALRSVRGAALRPGDRALVLGAGTIGLLTAMFARAGGAEVHLVGRSTRSLDFARALGFEHVGQADELPDLPWDAVIDASNDPALPAKAVDLVEPGRRVVFIGLAGSPSLVDTRTIAIKDVTAVGILSASGGLEGAIEAYASGAVDPRPLIAATVELEDLAPLLAGERPAGAGAGPKFQAVI